MEWNVLLVFVLDGTIIRKMTTYGLRFKAVDLFKDTIRRQLNESITRHSYNVAVDNLYRKTPEQVFRSGLVFKHGEIA